MFSNFQNCVMIFFSFFFFSLHPSQFIPLEKNHFTVLSGGFLETVKLNSHVHSTILNSPWDTCCFKYYHAFWTREKAEQQRKLRLVLLKKKKVTKSSLSILTEVESVKHEHEMRPWIQKWRKGRMLREILWWKACHSSLSLTVSICRLPTSSRSSSSL